MKNRIRLFASAVAVIGAALMVPMTASAASTAGAVVFEAPTASLTPVPALGTGVLATGAYHFTSSLGLCEGVSTDPGVLGCNIDSSGSYTNVQCGTGLAAGVANVSGSVNVSGAGYTIAFVSGVGVILPTGVTPTVAGVAIIVPTQGTCVTPVTQFTVVGAAVGTNP